MNRIYTILVKIYLISIFLCLTSICFAQKRFCRNLTEANKSPKTANRLYYSSLDTFANIDSLFLKLINLKRLDVITSGSILPKRIFTLSSIKSISIDDCENVKTIPNGILKLKNLEYISAERNRLQSIPNLGKLPKLQYVILSKNLLDEKSLNRFRTIKFLSIRYNRVKKLPVEFCKSDSLISFNAMNNLIKTIPPEIQHLKKIKNLMLCFNKIEVLPEEICNLKNLTYLELSYNKIKKLPNSIGKLQSLELLNLIENPISKKEILRIKKLLPNCTIYSRYGFFNIHKN